jgi:hypothetical protein
MHMQLEMLVRGQSAADQDVVQIKPQDHQRSRDAPGPSTFKDMVQIKPQDHQPPGKGEATAD